ncbi:helix-turn-helix domain-containing protein [Patescibacteria group bacterium]|nr:helix-turn-helix domain-containing protein [Patescibacteria group bacterium]
MSKNKHKASKKDTDSLFGAVLKLKTLPESQKFFRDLLTVEELNELSMRWRAAQMIDKGVPYREIAKKTGMSTATVSRVAYWLKYGKGGYKIAIKRSKKK